MRLLDARCVVTGVSSGIGLATARALSAAGARVWGLARGAEALSALREELGEHFVPLTCDLSDREQRTRVLASLLAAVDSVDLLVNNAAACVYASPSKHSAGELAALLEVNLIAAVELCQAFAPRMRAGAQIVQVSSVSARYLPTAKFGPYGSTKAALDHWTSALRMELAPRGVRVGLIVPGLVDTPIYDKLEGFDRARAKLDEQVPNWLVPEDVAEAILWMATRPAHVGVAELVVMPTAQTH